MHMQVPPSIVQEGGSASGGSKGRVTWTASASLAPAAVANDGVDLSMEDIRNLVRCSEASDDDEWLPEVLTDSGKRARPSYGSEAPWTLEEDLTIEQSALQYQRLGLRCNWGELAEQLPKFRDEQAVRDRWKELQNRACPSAPGAPSNARPPSAASSSASVATALLHLPSTSASSSPSSEARYDESLGLAASAAGVLPERSSADVLRMACAPGAVGPGRVGRAGGAPGAARPGDMHCMWQPEEDELIDHAVSFGMQWKAIEAMLPGKTAEGCCRRWLIAQQRRLASQGVKTRGLSEVVAHLRGCGAMPLDGIPAPAVPTPAPAPMMPRDIVVLPPMPCASFSGSAPPERRPRPAATFRTKTPLGDVSRSRPPVSPRTPWPQSTQRPTLPVVFAQPMMAYKQPAVGYAQPVDSDFTFM